MSKNIRTDKKGHPILNGAILYKYDIKPKIKKNNSFELKKEATRRLVSLMEDGSNADRLARQCVLRLSRLESNINDFNKEFSNSTKLVQMIYHNNKLKDLEEELRILEMGNNVRKLNFIKPTIKRQIEERKEMMNELYIDIKRDKITLSRTFKKNY